MASCLSGGRGARLLFPALALVLAACSGGGSHHAAVSPSATRTSPPIIGTVGPPSTAPTTSTPTQTPTPTAAPTTPAPVTQIIRVSPVTAAGKLAPGYTVSATYTGTSCLAGSDTGANAYRCFAGNGVDDPCWLDTDDTTDHTVVCLFQPWAKTVVRITTPQFMGTFGSPAPQAVLALQLSDGERCGALQGAHDDFDGRFIDYACDKRAVLRPLHTQSPLWLADTATDAPGTTARYTAGPTMTVSTAWVAVPSLSAPNSQ